MKTRIVDELYNLASGRKSDYVELLKSTYSLTEVQVRKQAAKILIDILHDYSAFNISTIDRFFQQTMRAFTREIGGNAPSEYLGAILKKVDGLTEDELQARVESHFVDYAKLKANDFNGYFIDRAKNLLSLIEKAMNKPVTDRDAENTLDQFGASLA